MSSQPFRTSQPTRSSRAGADRRRLGEVVEDDREISEPLDDERVGGRDLDPLADGLDRDRVEGGVDRQDRHGHGDRHEEEQAAHRPELPERVEEVREAPPRIGRPRELADVGMAGIGRGQPAEARPTRGLAVAVARRDPLDDAGESSEQIGGGGGERRRPDVAGPVRLREQPLRRIVAVCRSSGGPVAGMSTRIQRLSESLTLAALTGFSPSSVVGSASSRSRRHSARTSRTGWVQSNRLSPGFCVPIPWTQTTPVRRWPSGRGAGWPTARLAAASAVSRAAVWRSGGAAAGTPSVAAAAEAADCRVARRRRFASFSTGDVAMGRMVDARVSRSSRRLRCGHVHRCPLVPRG